jgi:hypothetical protein
MTIDLIIRNVGRPFCAHRMSVLLDAVDNVVRRAGSVEERSVAVARFASGAVDAEGDWAIASSSEVERIRAELAAVQAEVDSLLGSVDEGGDSRHVDAAVRSFEGRVDELDESVNVASGRLRSARQLLELSRVGGEEGFATARGSVERRLVAAIARVCPLLRYVSDSGGLLSDAESLAAIAAGGESVARMDWARDEAVRAMSGPGQEESLAALRARLRALNGVTAMVKDTASLAGSEWVSLSSAARHQLTQLAEAVDRARAMSDVGSEVSDAVTNGETVIALANAVSERWHKEAATAVAASTASVEAATNAIERFATVESTAHLAIERATACLKH